MKKRIAYFLIFAICSIDCTSQELGYVTGVSKIGINAGTYQPLYGFSLGHQFNKYLAIESNLIYSQRTIGSTTQADYFSFILQPKIGYWGKKIGVFYGPAIIFNPTLHHSNIENHSYLSTMQTLGLQINITQKIYVDMKAGYDFGLTGGYFENGQYEKYKGEVLLVGLKFKLNN